MSTCIKLLLMMVLITAKRSYVGQSIDVQTGQKKESILVTKYKKMVAQHFVSVRNVKEYASRLHVTPNHLNKTVKQETGKTAGEFIDEMLIMEIKALLRYSQLTITEITNRLDFADTSHLSKFFKKYTSLSPLAYRKRFA